MAACSACRGQGFIGNKPCGACEGTAFEGGPRAIAALQRASIPIIPDSSNVEMNPCSNCKGTGRLRGKVCVPCGGTKRGPPSMDSSYVVDPTIVK